MIRIEIALPLVVTLVLVLAFGAAPWPSWPFGRRGGQRRL